MTKVMVWNLPLRVFHWALVGSFVTAWLTLDDRYLDIHVFAGYLMAGLLLFRLLWGWLGGPYARFRDFSFSWRTALAYTKSVIKGHAARFIGHNPAGSWAIYLLLGLGLMIVITGLLALGAEERQGPLAGWSGFAMGSLFHELHEILSWLMLAVVAVHILGVIVESRLHRENLVAAMISGYKSVQSSAVSAASHRSVAIVMILLMLGAGLGWFHGYLVETPDNRYRPFVGRPLPDHELWREECGACHLAFHPSLLPARSWQRMMREQSSHFGEDLYLDQETIDEIQRFLIANAAEQGQTEAAWKINRSIPAQQTLLRITRAPYWIEKHQEIADEVWKNPRIEGKVNCPACHLDAEEGTFEDAAMRIPDQVATGEKK